MKIKTVDIKSDMPSADIALRRVSSAIYEAKREGYNAVKIIHGYGSTGKGGIIKTEVRKWLTRNKTAYNIELTVCGEDFHMYNFELLRQIMSKHQPLTKDCDYNNYNQGITILVFSNAKMGTKKVLGKIV